MARIVLESVSKSYGDSPAVDNVSLTIPDKQFVVLLGPSGSGKSTTLLMIAGLEATTAGHITFDGVRVDHLAASKRDVAMVFQNYALYPHMSVFDNMAFGLKIRRTRRDEVNRRVQTVAEKLGLDMLLTKKPSQLSGGQRQRVALGRAIVRQPRAFLMDEPLSNLDAKLRAQMRIELRQLQRELEATFVYVTHDQVEAMMMGDLVAVFEAGRIQQVGPPDEIYRRPATTFVAGFVGSPEMNLIRGDLKSSEDDMLFEAAFKLIGLSSDGRMDTGASVMLGLRPHEVVAFSEAPGPDASNLLPARVLLEEPMGADVFLTVDCGERLTVRSNARRRHPVGSTVMLDFSEATGHVFNESGNRIGSLESPRPVASPRPVVR